ncbi:hypothetical protein [Acinetobacter sp. ANC 4640]
MDERPAIPPDLNRANRIKEWHPAALAVFKEMLLKAKENLAKRNYPIHNAAVRREDFRKALEWEFGLHWKVAQEIEISMRKSGLIKFFGGYAVCKKGDE